MAEELKEKDDWVPVTPVKLVQGYELVNLGKETVDVDFELGNSNCDGACFHYDHGRAKKFDAKDCSAGVASNIGNVVVDNSSQRVQFLGLKQNSRGFTGGMSDKIEYQESVKIEVPSACIKGIRLENEHIHRDFGLDSSTANPSNAPSNPIRTKTNNCGVSLNKKKRPKMKRHRPKVYDESKPKKTPKSQINPLTPKNKTPKRVVHKTSPYERRKYTRKENPRDVVDGSLGSATYSCRQRLDFILENHARDKEGHGVFCGDEGKADSEVLGTSLQKDNQTQMQDGIQLSTNDFNVHVHAIDPIFYDAVKPFSPNDFHASQTRDYQNTKNCKELYKESLKLDFDLNLEVQDFESGLEIRKIIQEYQEMISNIPAHKEDLDSDKNTPTTVSTPQSGCKFSNLQVYKRIFRPNECLKNSRKMGPNFPKIYKRKRMKRKGATELHIFLPETKVDTCLRQKVASREIGLSRRNVKKIAKRVSTRKLSGWKYLKRARDYERFSDPTTIEYNLSGIQSTQRMKINGRVSYECLRNLCPASNFRKRRSWTPTRKGKRCGMFLSSEKEIAEEMKLTKLQEYDPPLNWLVKSKRSKTTTRVCNLSSFCELSKTFSKRNIRVLTLDKGHEKFEDCVEVHVKDSRHLDAPRLLKIPVVAGQCNPSIFNENMSIESKIDCICLMFESLRINDVCNQLVVRDQKVNGALIPRSGKFDPLKRRKILPKVDLDSETMRVWKLLMENDGSESIVEIDENKEKWWEDQREIFRGRIDSFISCMHLVQGDRRFSPWKGSVVDSVIGVFLTQNVSDHLSSSAFMSLAARFPPPCLSKQSDSNKNNACHQESVDNKESECEQSMKRNNKRPCLSSTELDMKENCICSTSKNLVEDGIVRNDNCHQESVDNKESECEQTVNGNNEQPCLSSTKLDMKEDCIFSTSKSLVEDGIVCNDACDQESVGNKESECEQFVNGNNEQPCLSSTKLDMKEDCIHSTSKILGEDGIFCNYVYHQESTDDKESECEQSVNGNNEQLCLSSIKLDMKEDCICSTSKSVGEDGIVCNDGCHQEFADNKESKCEQSKNGNNEQPCLCLIKLDMKEDCIWSISKSLGEDGIVSNDDCHQESVDNKESECEQSVNRNNEQPCLSSTKLDRKEDCICSTSKSLGEDRVVCNDAIQNIQGSFCHKSSTTNSRHCNSENSATFREVLLVEENLFLQQFYSHKENNITCDESIDTKFGDDVLSILDSSSSKCSTTIPSLSKVENSATFIEVLQVEESESLQQVYIDGENEMAFDESIGNVKFGDLQKRACNLTSDKAFNPEGYTVTSPLSQNLMKDIGKTKVKESDDISKHYESISGRKKHQTKEKQEILVKWDDLRKTYSCGRSKDAKSGNIDSANWEAVKQASVEEVAKVIMDRGMNNILAGRIKDFLDRIVEDHGTIDLEWLRDVPPDKAKDYLLSIPGLGLKSTECVRLLTLRHHAFPVDTNVGRILVRLGWVPLLPLPEDVQIHLLNAYPLVDTIQKYIWTRVSTFSKQTLYEFHYQMITFGKVFCTKKRPNCNVCPMRGQCRHFASAYASARLRIRGSQEKGVESESTGASHQDHQMDSNRSLSVHFDGKISGVGNQPHLSEPIIEFPPSPKPDSREILERDIEDFDYDKEDEIPTINLSEESFTKNILDFIGKTNFLLGEGEMSQQLVVLSPKAASIPMPQLKSVVRLRTVHQVYELPDSHPLLAGFEKREPDDPCPYLFAIWITDETINSSQLPRNACSYQESTCDIGICCSGDTFQKRDQESTCDIGICCSGDTFQKRDDEFIQGTILIPCRTANRGSFPLNGTYFQVNEVFADHVSSQCPLAVPRKLIWNLRRRSLYCGTSTTSIFRGMSTEEIQYCFWRGFICVKGIDWASKAPKPLSKRFHFCKTRQVDKE